MAVPPMLIKRKRRINELKMPDYPPLLVDHHQPKTNFLFLRLFPPAHLVICRLSLLYRRPNEM